MAIHVSDCRERERERLEKKNVKEWNRKADSKSRRSSEAWMLRHGSYLNQQ